MHREKNDFFFVTFGVLAMSIMAKVMFGCVATIDYLSYGAILLEEYFASGGELKAEWEIHALLRFPT